jgi:hypothetical protein
VTHQSALVADRLVDAGVVAVIGAYNSTPPNRLRNLQRSGYLHITPSSTATRLTEKTLNSSSACASWMIARRCSPSWRCSRSWALRRSASCDEFDLRRGLADWTRIYAEEVGLVAFYDAINPDDQDFTPILTNIGEAGWMPSTSRLSRAGRPAAAPDCRTGPRHSVDHGQRRSNPEMVEIAGGRGAGTYITTEPLPPTWNIPKR